MKMAAAISTATTTTSQLPHRLSLLIPTIASLLQTINTHQANPNPSILNQFSQHLTPNLVIQIIKNQTSPYHSLLFFNWASNASPNPNNYYHTHHCYIAITDHLLSHKLFSLAYHLLESHNKLSDFMVGKFIKAHGDLGHIKWAINLFNKIKKRENGFCLFSYNSLLGVVVKSDRVDLAWGYFGLMIKENVVKPDVSTYTMMIKGFCKVGKVGNAKKVFEDMECEKNLVCYNTMINGLCKKGLVEKAREIVNKMVERGECLPDVVSYSTLIDGYCKAGEVTEAKRYFDEMVERGCEANVLTYNALINGLCLNGEVDEAKRTITRMRLNGLRDDVTTHTCLLKGYCIAGRSEEAIRHFKEMVTLGVKVDGKSYGVVVNELCKLSKPGDAVGLLREMKTRGINPSVASFNAVFRSFMNLGELDKAMVNFKQMQRMGCDPNFISYSTVISGLVRAKGRMHEVEILVNDMRQDGQRLDATLYSCLVKGYCENGNDEIAIQAFREMIDESYVINLESFAVFVKELCAKGKVFELEQLFEQMRDSLPLRDAASYERILNKSLCGTDVC